MLRPSPAAVLVAGTAFSLTSRGGRDTAHRLAGRRVLPSLTLRDLPTTPSAHAQDDLGGPAQPRTLVDDGRIRPPAPLREGIPVGRAVWDHDSGACAPPPLARLELLGPDLPLPSHAVELVRCVEDFSATTRTAPYGCSAWRGSRSGPGPGSPSCCGANPCTCCAGPVA